jgi:hypothetical protein
MDTIVKAMLKAEDDLGLPLSSPESLQGRDKLQFFLDSVQSLVSLVTKTLKDKEEVEAARLALEGRIPKTLVLMSGDEVALVNPTRKDGQLRQSTMGPVNCFKNGAESDPMSTMVENLNEISGDTMTLKVAGGDPITIGEIAVVAGSGTLPGSHSVALCAGSHC